ncbi:MAG: hypothetical protein O2968_06550 [Acidobacteria bacterium]|nr:hypothetical protein [Acidobacteriota bacterium]
MTYFRRIGSGRRRRARYAPYIVVALLIALACVAQAQLADWVRYVESGSTLRDVFFRTVALPSGAIRIERSPAETRTALSLLVERSPSDADLYALHGHEAERQLDFIAAEADWKRHAELAADPATDLVSGQLALADYYHRRLQPREEVDALLAVGAAPSAAQERFTPLNEQRSWSAFERILEAAEAQAFPVQDRVRYLQAWRQRYPNEASVHQQLFNFLLESKQYAAARTMLGEYTRQFPADTVFPTQGAAALARAEGSRDSVLAFYEQEFQPLWPQALIRDYFTALQEADRLRAALDQVNTRLRQNPDDLRAAAWLFHYYQRQGNGASAQGALHEYRQSKEARQADWTAEELDTLSKLFGTVRNANEAARFAYALYSLPGAAESNREQALVTLISLLLTSPEQGIEFGSGDLSLYRDIATMDDQPGFLNGILSLLFNAQYPQYRFSSQERTSVAYFHRGKAAELLKRFDTEFPGSNERASLHFQVISAYATYGDNAGVISKGRGFLTAFPNAGERTQVSLLMAEAYARNGQTAEEFQVYDALLVELAAKADGVPLGERSAPSPPPRYSRSGRSAAPVGDRSPEYARILDRYIARLVSLKQLLPAVELYAREIERNPDDPGLYERFAGFLQQNGLGDRVESLYRDAIEQFDDRSWHHKLARWYLGQKRATEFEELTRGIIAAFSGSDLESYFQQVIAQSSLDAVLYRQVNLYAHERFPHNLTFVRNLLAAYTRRQTRDPVAYERLLREYWFYDDALRTRFFQRLTSAKQLESELNSLKTSIDSAGQGRWQRLARENPAAAQIIAEGEVWRCHFEDAAPVLLALTTNLPATAERSERIASVHRSLAHKNPFYTDVAVAVLEGRQRYEPRDRELLARIGDTAADRELFERSAPFWQRMPAVEPGKPEGYLEAATVFWDYYRFDDSLRLMQQGRDALGRPELYAYEAGAVHENRRDYDAALDEYLKGALADDGYSPARSRFLRLARRTAYREKTDAMTAALVSGASPDPKAVSLRVDLLQTQVRYDDLKQLLTRLARTTDSFELLDRIGQLANQHRADDVTTLLLRRRIELTSDPVDQMRLKLSLMHHHEQRGEQAEARAIIDDLYRGQARILGVVRGAADYHWRQKNYDRAFQILDEAAAASYPALKESFTFETARKATEAERYEDARRRLRPLLDDKPFDGRYLGAMAETFGRENDQQALRAFYEGKITEMLAAELPRVQKNQQIATLRHGLIPALTKLGEHSSALDQYIEIINRFPEDSGLVQEAADYANRHSRREQLENFYVKTTTDSPKDFRYHVVLALVRTQFENLPGAIGAYEDALNVRPERSDFWEAKASIEERLLRFEAAFASYNKLYELNYENPRWMEKVAEVHARRGERPEAVAAVKKALIEGRPERPENYFNAAQRLEQWNYLSEAVEIAEQGIVAAGETLYQYESSAAGARHYIALMTRLRRYEEGFATLAKALPAQPNELQQNRYRATLQAAAQPVEHYFTPEEKSAFVAFLTEQRRTMRRGDVEEGLLPLVEQAGLAETQAQWLHELMMASPGSSQTGDFMRRLIELQRCRLRHDELGRQLEEYWRVHPVRAGRDSILISAAHAYFSSGNEDSEFRVLDTLAGGEINTTQWRDRYYELLLTRRPDALVALARDDSAANFLIARGDADLALRAVATRGGELPPVWSLAYTGLAGLHFGRQTPQVRDAFVRALGSATIGERIGVEIDRGQQLAGDLWYYYGSRYGEFLAAQDAGEAEAYLPASVETATGRAGAYFDLAAFYSEQQNFTRALEEYEHALELNASLGNAHDRVAEILWQQGRRDEAIARWRTAIEAFQQQQSGYTETFWDDVPRTLHNIGSRNLHSELREPVSAFFDLYVRRNGGYRSGELIRPWIETAQDRQQELSQFLALAAKANDPLGFLAPLTEAAWLTAPERAQALEQAVNQAREAWQRGEGQAKFYARQAYDEWQIRWLKHLLADGQAQRAAGLLDSASDSLKAKLLNEEGPLVIRIAALSGRLDEVLRRYSSAAPRELPSLQALPRAATELRAAGDRSSAERLLDFYYTRLLDQRDFSAANFLGLAELRFEQQRPQDALALLRRMLLISGEPFEHHMAAADLLSKFDRHSEAAAILSERIQATPWDADARLLQARAQTEATPGQAQATAALLELAASSAAAYSTRAEAARSLRGVVATVANLASGELNTLAGRINAGPAPAAAPFLYEQHVDAAANAADPADKARLLQQAIAARPAEHTNHRNLLQAARDAGDHRLAVFVFDPLLGGTNMAGFMRPRSFTSDAQQVPPIDDWMSRQFLGTTNWSADERRDAALLFADSLDRIGRLTVASRAYQIGLKFDLLGDRRAEAEQSLASVNDRIRLQVQNAQRRPFIHKNLDQENIVRPRLASATQVTTP